MSYVYAQCLKCGYRWEIHKKRINLRAKCESCRMPASREVRYGDQVCLAWQGDFDEEDRPVRDGVYYLPGVRLCNHRDCVNIEHIVPFD